MAVGAPPNYYAILEVHETATTAQIREAYKRAALQTHPDRVPADSPQRATRTRNFQLVNDAYYTLSDPTRRSQYDAQRRKYGTRSQSANGDYDPFAEAAAAGSGDGGSGRGPDLSAENVYSWAWNFFTSQVQGWNNSNNNNTKTDSTKPQTNTRSTTSGFTSSKSYADARRQTDNDQFADVFEEMLREEGMDQAAGTNNGANGKPQLWSVVGGLSGGMLGFIMGNMPGLFAGAVAGNRLGSVRDAKGKSVYAVFQELPINDRTRLLTQLASKVFSHTVGA